MQASKYILFFLYIRFHRYSFLLKKIEKEFLKILSEKNK